MLLMVCFSGLSGQVNKKALQEYEAAKQYLKSHSYGKALQALDRAEQYNAGMASVWFLRADLYHQLKDTDNEILSMQKGFALDSTGFTAYYFYLGEGYFSRGAYAEALAAYRKYTTTDAGQNRVEEARKRIANCLFALEALRTGERQSVELFIGSEKDVYWPSLDITGKTVLYTRLENDEENIRMYRDSADYYLNINTPFYNEGTQSLTADGQMLYFTGCNLPDSRGSCDIYVSYRISDTLWSEPVNLGDPINTDAWEAQPSVSPDGTRLFFASSRAGSKGGCDIWYSVLRARWPGGRQIWSPPQPLLINTPGNEMAPFLYYDGKILFFASDNYPGMGGMDIYKVDLEGSGEPENIGITVNTHRNEMGFAVDATGKWGYFASDRDGLKNIYRYRLEEEVACEEVAYMQLLVENEEGRGIVPDRVFVQDMVQGDTLFYYNEAFMPRELITCVPSDCRLLVSVLKKGYLYCSDTMHVGRAAYDAPQTKILTLRKIRPERVLVLKGVFFDVDRSVLKPESKRELEQLVEFLKMNPEVKIEISGHTDDSGTDEHNDRLSEERAFEVYKYLFLNRIKKERMQYRGYGKREPVAPNDTEEGRAKNRRTEIKVLE